MQYKMFVVCIHEKLNEFIEQFLFISENTRQKSGFVCQTILIAVILVT